MNIILILSLSLRLSDVTENRIKEWDSEKGYGEKEMKMCVKISLMVRHKYGRIDLN